MLLTQRLSPATFERIDMRSRGTFLEFSLRGNPTLK
jgi:hypothetical protein